MPNMRRERQIFLTLCLAAPLVAGCAQNRTVYLFEDGRVVANDPALSRQYADDRRACNDLMARSIAGGDHSDGGLTRGAGIESVGDDCMVEKGYVAVPQDQVPAKQRELAAEYAAETAAAAAARRN